MLGLMLPLPFLRRSGGSIRASTPLLSDWVIMNENGASFNQTHILRNTWSHSGILFTEFKSLSYIREINSSTCGRSDVTQKPCLVLPFNIFSKHNTLAEIIISSLTNTALCGPLVNHTKYVYYHNAENFIAW